DVFSLLDTLMSGQTAKGLRMLSSLKAEGVAAPVVLWALSREIRSLAEMANELEQGRNSNQVMAAYRVWDKRKPVVGKALSRESANYWRELLIQCSDVDRMIKGLNSKDPWLALKRVAQGVSGIACL
ncbi:MAG: DNA polymerase III subunit delta, partial [Candidatus Thiodiazotropha sp. (ex Ctena orbiculata)]|nr:DNA polymerase III subunit delta [Candidatus Thiodiazotropha taylori]